MAQLPHDRLPDSTLAFMRDGYEFISNRCRRYRSEVFQTRVLSRPHQDLHVSGSRIPARPRSGFIMRDVRPAEAGG